MDAGRDDVPAPGRTIRDAVDELLDHIERLVSDAISVRRSAQEIASRVRTVAQGARDMNSVIAMLRRGQR